MPSPSVQAALLLSASRRAAALTALPEDQWFDRKSLRIAPKDLAADLVGFANAEGGTIIVGLSNGAVENVASDAAKENALRQAAVDFTVPAVRVRAERVPVGDGPQPVFLLALHIEPSELVHETRRGDCYLRVGDETRKLNYAQRQELHFDRGTAHFEASAAPGVSVDMLDDVQIGHLGEEIGFAPATPAATILQSRSLLTLKEEVTVAGYLLTAAHPQLLYPQALVRVLRYRSPYRGTGRHQTLDAEGDRRLEGSIATIIRAAQDLIAEWVPKRRALTASGRFEDIPVIPQDAWLEGLVNAVVHRSYSLTGDHIRVEIFPDRIEIESPGRFPGLADPRRPLEVSRYARNPRIARVCSDLRITQERGEGIRRIFDQMRSEGLVDPVYEQGSGSVRLSLIAASRLDPDLQERLPVGAADVITVLREARRPLGTGEIMAAVGRSRPWVRDVLEALREEGQIEWRGASPRDPRAAWSLFEDRL